MIGKPVAITAETFMERLQEEKSRGTKVAQCLLTSPQELSVQGLRDFLARAPKGKVPIPTVVHGSPRANLVSPIRKGIGKRSLNYLVELAHVCHELGVTHIVSHLNKMPPGYVELGGYNHCLSFCKEWLKQTEGLNTVLNLETSTGSADGRNLGSVSFLIRLVEEINHHRIRICWDTEHTYAHGFDLSDKKNIENLMKYVSVIHLNSIPEDVEFSGHLDKHANTLLKDSKEGTVEHLIYIAKKAQNLNIPTILERSAELISADIEFLRENGVY